MPPANLPRVPWVSHSDLLDHLTILNAFHHLRTLRPEPEFLHMALFRFELWIGRLELFPPIDSLARLPPLDVLMVWHAYCLGSRWYFEDSRRVYPILQIVDFPLSLAASQYRRLSPKSQTLGVEIPEQAMIEWFDKTNTIFDPILYFSTPSFRTTLCPRCESRIETRFTNRLKRGWAESFECRLKCDGCGWTGVKSDLSLHKFIRDIQSITFPPLSKLAKFDSLAGTLSTSKGLEDMENVHQFNHLMTRLLTSSSNVDPSQPKQAPLDPQAALQIVKVLTTLPRISKSEGVGRMMSAYSVSEPFSLDLITYMKRQESFRNIIIHLGWGKAANPSAKVDVELASQKTYSGFAINRAASRYQAFVDLVRDAADTQSIDTCIPTYDIDLAWRTHQLKGVRFSTEMAKYIGHPFDHFTDRIFDRHTLIVLFESTSKAWEKRYNVMYSRYPPPDLSFERPEAILKAMIQGLPSRMTPLPRKVERVKDDAIASNVLEIESISIEPGQAVRFVIDQAPSATDSVTQNEISRPVAEQEQRAKFGLEAVSSVEYEPETNEEKPKEKKSIGLFSGGMPRVADVFIPQEDKFWGEKLMKDLISVVNSSLDRSADLKIQPEPGLDHGHSTAKPGLVRLSTFGEDDALKQDGLCVDQSIVKVNPASCHQEQVVTDFSQDLRSESLIIPNITKSRSGTPSPDHSEVNFWRASTEDGQSSARPTVKIASINSSPSTSIDIIHPSASTVDDLIHPSASTVDDLTHPSASTADDLIHPSASTVEAGDIQSQTDTTPKKSLNPVSHTEKYHRSREDSLGSTAVGSDESNLEELENYVSPPNSASGSRFRLDDDVSRKHSMTRVVAGSETQAEIQTSQTSSFNLNNPSQSIIRRPSTGFGETLDRKRSLPSISRFFRSASGSESQHNSQTGNLLGSQLDASESLRGIQSRQQKFTPCTKGPFTPPRRMQKKNHFNFSEGKPNEIQPRTAQVKVFTPAPANPLRPSTAPAHPSPVDRACKAANPKGDKANKASFKAASALESEKQPAPPCYQSSLPRIAFPAMRHSRRPGTAPDQNNKNGKDLSAKSMLLQPASGILKHGLSASTQASTESKGPTRPPRRNPLRRENSDSNKSVKISWGEDVGATGKGGLRKTTESKPKVVQPKAEDEAQGDEEGVEMLVERNCKMNVIELMTEVKGVPYQSGELTPKPERGDVCSRTYEKGKAPELLKKRKEISKVVIVEDGVKKVRGIEEEELNSDLGSESSGVESFTIEDEFGQLMMNIPIGRIGFVEGSEIRLLEV